MFAKPLFILLTFVLAGCSGKEAATEYSIRGKAPEAAGDTVYVHKYDHFDYSNKDYILDSTIVDEQGNFEFSFSYEPDKLVYVSQYNAPPPSYRVLRPEPEYYYYSFCANFFGMEPTLYLENDKAYKISHWDQNNSDSSIKFEDQKMDLLRNYYRTVNYRTDLSDENRDPLNIDPELAWQMLQNKREGFLKEYQLEKDQPVDTFEGYLKTEILLGAVNDFFVWYKNREDSEEDPELVEKILQEYHSANWNSNSVEYFKLTERYVTHQMNLQKGQSATYYPPNEDKLEYAMSYSREDIREQYTNNLKNLMREQKE